MVAAIWRRADIMASYLLRRVLTLVPVLFLVSFLSFGLIYLIPGDPAVAILGENANNPALLAALREEMGLDKPFLVQYWNWLNSLLSGHLGETLTGRSVAEQVGAAIWPTIELATLAMIIALTVGLLLGILAAFKERSRIDAVASALSIVGFAAPGFLVGMVLLYAFAVNFPLFPSGGYIPFFENPFESLWAMVLPAAALGVSLSAVLMRQMRTSMLQTLAQDYILVARAKGLAPKVILFRHALKNSMIPVLTIIGMQLGSIFGGVAVIETVFSIPGLGRLSVDAIANRNYAVLQAVILLCALIVIAANFITDLLYALVDPRVRYA